MRKKIPHHKHRLSVFVSNKYIYAQIICNGKTLVSESSMKMGKPANIDTAKQVGENIGTKAVKSNIKSIIFDRGRKKYHGKIKALADMVRAQGIIF